MVHDPLRLLHVFATFDVGGPQVRTIEVASALGDGFAHSFVAADGRYGAATRLRGIANAEVVALPRSRGFLAMTRALRRCVRWTDPHLVLTYNWGATPGAMAARVERRPFVHHEEVVPPEERRTVLRRRLWLRRCLLRAAHAVVVPSHSLVTTATNDWRVPPSRVRHVANGVDLRRHQAVPHHRLRRLVVGCVAHARPEKNLPRLLDAFARLRIQVDAELHIVGAGPDFVTCQRRAAALGIEDAVVWHGCHDDPAPLYDRMDVFVLPSDDEQMPLALLEAMAHALPIVATDVGDVRRMLPPTQHRFVVAVGSTASADIAACLRDLAGDPALRHRLGADNRDHAERHHDLNATVRRYGELYRHAARPSDRRRARA